MMELGDVIQQSGRFGSIAYLATTSPRGVPHVVPVHLDWKDARLYCMVGLSDAKTRHMRDNPAVCLHYPVSEATGYDSLIVWGRARILDTDTDRRRLWTGVLSYDLDRFAPGGPEASPDVGFCEITPCRALLLESFGEGERREWRAG